MAGKHFKCVTGIQAACAAWWIGQLLPAGSTRSEASEDEFVLLAGVICWSLLTQPWSAL
jgi:hypothetical protein